MQKIFFSDTLFNSSEGKSIGFSYFKERGFSDETIKKYDLGYLPVRINDLARISNINFKNQRYLWKKAIPRSQKYFKITIEASHSPNLVAQ